MPLALLGVLATVLAAFPYYIAGFADQPAGSATFDYSGPSELWNVLVLVGHALMGLTVLAFAGLAAATFRGDGDTAGDDPWDAQTIEWSTSSPAPGNNFSDVPIVASPEPLLDLKHATDGSRS
jgi:heme/copper-type cytochrome/quinol oxidase subunit 1